MPLQKALIETSLTSGLQQKSNDRVDTVETAEVMTNCVKTKEGGVRKRVGCKQLVKTLRARANALGGASFVVDETQAVRGLNYGQGPLLFDGYKFSAYSDARADWNLIDSVPEAVAGERIPIASVLNLGGDTDYSANNNYHVTAMGVVISSTIRHIHVTITDDTNKAVVLQSVISGPGTMGLIAKVVVVGNFAVVMWEADPGPGTPGLYWSRIDLTDIGAGWTSATLFDTVDVTTFALFDVMPMQGSSTRFCVGYFKGGNVQFKTVTASTMVVGNSVSKAPGAGNLTSIGILGVANDHCWIVYTLDTGAAYRFEYFSFSDAAVTSSAVATLYTTTTTAIGTAPIGIARISSTNAVIFWHDYQRTSPPFYNTLFGQQVLTTGAVVSLVGAQRKTPGLMLASKPALVTTPEGVRCYMVVNTNSSLQGTMALVCFDWFGQGASPFGDAGASNVPARLVVTVAPRLAKSLGVSAGGFGPGGVFSPAKLVGPIAPNRYVTLVYINQNWASGTLLISNSTGTFIQSFEFDSQIKYFGGVIAGGNLLGVSGGAPFMYDRNVISEMGFLWYPEMVATLTAGGPNTGTFSYIAVYEWTDAVGNIHRGATSPPVTVSPVGQHVVLTIPTIGVTWRHRHCPTVIGTSHVMFPSIDQTVKIVVYATGNGGTTYYRQVEVENDTSVTTITVTDPGTGTTSQLLYTTGGVLDNYIPPSARICIVHKNRWFLGGCDDPTAIWPSKALTVGEAPGFNEEMNIYATGAVTALASLDEKLIVFVRRGTDAYGIEYVVGDGPFDTGAANDFTNPPQPVPSAVGALDQRSIAVFEGGVVFMSPVGAPNGGGGIFLLSRDLQVHYLSGPVEDYVAANPVCTGVVVHPNNGRIYFEMALQDSLGNTTPGVRLVYDYLMNCWSIDTHYSFIAVADGLAARTTWVAGGLGLNAAGAFLNMPLVYWADYSGSVYREHSGVPLLNSHTDTASNGDVHWITATFTSAWFKPALSGFARFWRAQLQSDRLDPAALTVSFQFDYAPASYYSETMSFTATEIAAFDRVPQVDVEHLVGNQKAKAIQVTLVDANPGTGYTTGQGFQWSTLTLEVGVDQGGRNVNLPSRQRG